MKKPGSTNSLSRRATYAALETTRKDISSADLDKYRRLFLAVDVDGSGFIDMGELQFMFRCVDVNLNDEEVRQIANEFDQDNDGLIDFNEFVEIMHQSHDLIAAHAEKRAQTQLEHIYKSKTKRFLSTSRGRWTWDVLVLVVTLYFSVIVIYDFYDLSTFTAVQVAFEVIFTVVFAVDMGVHANSAFQDDDGRVQMNLDVVLKRYAQKWLLIDLLGMFPFDLIAVAAGANHVVIQIFRGFRLFRVLRVTQTLFPKGSLTGMLTADYVNFVYRIAPILQTFFTFILFVHVLSVGTLFVFSDIKVGEHRAHEYDTAMYFVLYMLTTCGVGDVSTPDTKHRIWAAFLMLVGVAFNGIVISNVSSFLNKTNIAADSKNKMRETLAVLNHFNIPVEIQDEILSFQAHVLDHNLGTSHQSIVSSLPQGIQESLNLFMKIKYISMVPMFATATQECKISLAHCLGNIVYRPNEFIIIAGEEGREMYFLGHGTADVIIQSGMCVATLRKGDFFGEVALVVEGTRRTASIKALTYCDVFRLKKTDFSAILMKYPQFRESVKEEMNARAAAIVAAPKMERASSIRFKRKQTRAEADIEIMSASGQDELETELGVPDDVKKTFRAASDQSQLYRETETKGPSRASAGGAGAGIGDLNPKRSRKSIFCAAPDEVTEFLDTASDGGNTSGPQREDAMAIARNRVKRLSYDAFAELGSALNASKESSMFSPMSAMNTSSNGGFQSDFYVQKQMLSASQRPPSVSPPAMPEAGFSELIARMERIEQRLAAQQQNPSVGASKEDGRAPRTKGSGNGSPSPTFDV